MNAFRAILAKDLRTELRTLESVPAMALFAATTFVLFRFGLDRTTLEGSLAAGVLLATVLFAAILAINEDARNRSLQVALCVPLLAGLLGVANSLRMMRLPDVAPSASLDGVDLG